MQKKPRIPVHQSSSRNNPRDVGDACITQYAAPSEFALFFFRHSRELVLFCKFNSSIITSIENVQDDINAMISDLETMGSSDKEFIRQNFADTIDELTEIQTYMDKYLRLVDREDLSKAKIAAGI